MSLKKVQVNVALAGMSETVSSRVADFSTSLALAENVVYDQTGVPRTRNGYGRVIQNSGDNFGPASRGSSVCKFSDGSNSVISDACQSVVVESGALYGDKFMLSTQVPSASSLPAGSLLTPFVPSLVGSMSARQTPPASNGNDYYSYGCYISSSELNATSGAGLINGGFIFTAKCVKASSSTAWSSATSSPVVLYEVRSRKTGEILFSGTGTVSMSSGTQVPFQMCVYGYKNVVFVSYSGIPSANSITTERFLVTSSGVTSSSSTTAVDFLGSSGAMAVSYDETHATESRLFLAYTTNSSGEFKVLRLDSTTMSTAVSFTENVSSMDGLAFNSFGLRYHPENDELFFAFTDSTGTLNIQSREAVSFLYNRNAGPITLGYTTGLDSVYFISRATIEPGSEDATGSSLKCWGACLSWTGFTATAFGSVIPVTNCTFVQLGTPVSSDNMQTSGYTGGGFSFSGCQLAAGSGWNKYGSIYYTTLAIAHSSLVTPPSTSNSQESVIVYRVDGRSNLHPGMLTGGFPGSAITYMGSSQRRLTQISSVCTGTYLSRVTGAQQTFDLSLICTDRSDSFYDSCICLPSQDSPTYNLGASYRGSQINIYKVSSRQKDCTSSEYYYGSVFSSGSIVGVYGQKSSSVGFPCRPMNIYLTSFSAGSVIPSGAIYRAMLETEVSGNVAYSELSFPVSVAGGASMTFDIFFPPVDVGSRYRVVLFRNDGAGDRFIASRDVFTSELSFQYVDTASSSSIEPNAQPYYDPASVGSGSPLPRTPPPGVQHICQHNDRLFVIDEDNNIRYTGPMVRGESPWFSEVFKIPPPSNARPVALASNGSYLVIFTSSSVYSITGDGPPENGGNGTEFSPPQLLVDGIGCIDKRTVLQTPMGVVFCSERGIELINKGGQLQFIGEPVQKTFALYPNKVAATFDGRTGTLKVLACSGTEPRGGFVAGSSGGAIFVYRFSTDTWSIHKVAVDNVEDSVFCDMTTMRFSDGERTALLSSDGRLFIERREDSYVLTIDGPVLTYGRYWDPTPSGSARPVKCKLRTHDYKVNNAVNSRFRLYDAEIVALNKTNHSMKMDLYYNYVYTAPGITRTFEPPVTQASPEILVVQPNKEQLVACALEVSWQAPADTATYPPTTGEGAEVLQAAINIGIQEGFPLVPAVQRK